MNAPMPDQTMIERVADEPNFKVGDIVTRDGTDLQRVVKADPDWRHITVECIRASDFNWCKVGDIEDNLMHRYSFASQVIDAALEDGRASIS